MDEDVGADDDGSGKDPPHHDKESQPSTSVPAITSTFLGEEFM